MVAPFLPDDEKLAAVRGALPALAAGIFLNTGSVGPLPAETAAAMAELVDYELRIGRSHPDYWEGFLERMAEARASVAAVVGADVGEIGLVHSTSQAMNAAVWSVDLDPGDRIVTTQAEHPGGLGPVHVAAARAGAELVIADVGTGDDDDATLAAFDATITHRTRIVALSHVLWTTGALWCNPAIVADSRPTNASWFTFERLTMTEAIPWRDARRFEDSGHYRPGVTGLARSCGWLSMYIGLPWIHERGQAMARIAADRLAGIAGVELITPRDRMATLVTFRIPGWSADQVLAELNGRIFAIARTIPPLDAVRISVGFFTSEDEIERVAQTVALLAAHTPASLPPRPRLVVLGQGEG